MEQSPKEQYYNEITKGGELPIDEAANEEMQQANKLLEDALNITVIGDAVNPTEWSAVLYGVEVHFD